MLFSSIIRWTTYRACCSWSPPGRPRWHERALTSDRIPVSFDTTFHQFAELDLPTWIESTDEGDGTWKVLGTQEGRTVFECVVGTAERSAILYEE